MSIKQHKILLQKIKEAKSGTGYELHHQTLGSAIDTAIAHAKKKFGINITPDERMDKVGMGPRKPATNDTNMYRLIGTDRRGKERGVQVQVYNMGDRYELNMYKESVDEGFMDKMRQLVPGAKGKPAKKLQKKVKKSDNAEQIKVAAEINRKLKLIDGLMKKVGPLGGQLGRLMAFRRLPLAKMTPKGMYIALNAWYHSVEDELDYGDDSVDLKKKYQRSVEDLYELWEEVGFRLSDYMWASGYDIKGIGQMAKIGFPAKKRTDPEWLKMNESVELDEKAPKIDPKKYATHMNRNKKKKTMSSTKKNLSDISKRAEKMANENMDEMVGALSMEKAAAELEAYAKKSGGMDKNTFMRVATLLKTGHPDKLKSYINNMDTDPREYVAMLLKKHIGKKSTEKMMDIKFRGESISWEDAETLRAAGVKLDEISGDMKKRYNKAALKDMDKQKNTLKRADDVGSKVVDGAVTDKASPSQTNSRFAKLDKIRQKADKKLANRRKGLSTPGKGSTTKVKDYFGMAEKNKSNLGRTMKLVNKIKDSGVVKSGSMSKEKSTNERTQKQSMFNRMFAGKKDTSWMDASNKKYSTKKDKGVQTKTHSHKKNDKGPANTPHTHTTDHTHKTVR